MATTIERDDLPNNKGLKITRTFKRFDFDSLEDVEEAEVIYIHQSDIQARRDSLQQRQDQIDEETAKIDALEAKLTTLWQNAS